jgi:hypothetical protein
MIIQAKIKNRKIQQAEINEEIKRKPKAYVKEEKIRAFNQKDFGVDGSSFIMECFSIDAEEMGVDKEGKITAGREQAYV